jgi:hypothetical protein
MNKVAITTYFLIAVGFGIGAHENHNAGYKPAEILASVTVGIIWPAFVGAQLAKTIHP